MPLSCMVTPPSPALESKLLVKDKRKWAFDHPQLSALPRTRGEDLFQSIVYPEASGLRTLRESTIIYTTSLLRGICFGLAGGGVCVCPHTQAPCVHLYDQCCNKHPCTWALRWRLSFLWNRFSGVGLLGQRGYVFLISMDFS